jgi:hypothetical protein
MGGFLGAERRGYVYKPHKQTLASDQFKKPHSPSFDPSLKDGRGAMPASRKPLAGTMPCGLGFMQMVPPVMTISTRDSGYCVAMLGKLVIRLRG